MATSYTKLNDIRKLTEQLYLAFGNSPSSFLHLTVGTGSPLASHLNSALSSTVTAKLLGLFTKDGLSKGKNNNNKKRIKGLVQQFCARIVIFPQFQLLENRKSGMNPMELILPLLL